MGRKHERPLLQKEILTLITKTANHTNAHENVAQNEEYSVPHYKTDESSVQNWSPNFRGSTSGYFEHLYTCIHTGALHELKY